MATTSVNNISVLPFNLESFKKGAKAINGLGQEVKFLTETRGKLFVVVKTKFGKQSYDKMEMDGRKYAGTETNYDIYMVA